MMIVERPGRDRLGEGPVWDAVRGELLWVDILAPCLHRLDLANSRITTTRVEEALGWIAPRRGRADYIAGFRSGFYVLDIETGARRLIGDPEPDRPDNRLNDAKVDPQGRLWAGSKDDTDRAASGALYRLDPALTWTRCDDHYGVANGPTFSPDGRTLYHTDSAARTIYAFDLRDDGSLSRRRVAQVSRGLGLSGRHDHRRGGLRVGGSLGRRASQPLRARWRPGAVDHAAGALFEVVAGVKGLAPVRFAG